MHRFYFLSQNISGDKINISDKSQVHHLKDVLRLKPKDEVMVFDDRGNEYKCTIEKLLAQSAALKINKIHKFLPSKVTKVALACAIPKGSRMDEIIDKLTQLGVQRIIPLETERVIIKLDKHKKILRQERWKKLALNASLQSQRNTLPILEPIKNIKELLSDSESFDLKLIPTLTEERKPLKEVLEESKPENILVIIGPEGDFTSGELDLAKKVGCIPVSLGNSVLRVETAAVAVVSFIRLYYGNR